MHARARTALIGTAIAAAGVALLRVLAFSVAGVHHRDALALHDFMGLDRPLTHHLASALANAASPAEFGLLGAAIIGVALLRRRPPLAAAAAVILLGSAFTTDRILKPALAAPRADAVLGFHQIDSNAFPSGHATASMALALSAVLVAGRRWRPLVAIAGALFAVGVSYSLLSLGWHYPSDVLAGYLVAMAWTGVVVAGLTWQESRDPARAPRRPLPRVEWAPALALAGLVVVAAAVLVLLAASDHPFAYVRDHKVLAAVAGTIAAAGVAVAGGLALVLRDRPD
jgi:membrane-associated phospholipid phosphatase